MTRSALLLSLALLCAAGLAQGAGEAEPRLAIKGYDPVAYFTVQKPVKGTVEFREDFDGARYYFSSANNRKAFAASPRANTCANSCSRASSAVPNMV